MADVVALQDVMRELPANVGSALALVPAMEWAKRSGLRGLGWINMRTAPALSVAMAALVALGIHVSGQGHYDAATGVYTYSGVISGLTFAGVGSALFEVGKQWLGQHWTHKFYQAFDTAKSLAVALNRITATPTASVAGATGTGDGKPAGPAGVLTSVPMIGGGGQ